MDLFAFNLMSSNAPKNIVSSSFKFSGVSGDHNDLETEIGRASCRERVSSPV